MRIHIAVLLIGSTAASYAHAADPPKTWVDRDTGHRVWRLSNEPGSSAFYFNVNAYSPDGRYMVYTARDGIHTLDLATRKTRLLVPNPPDAGTSAVGLARFMHGNHAIVVGRKTDSIFFSRFDNDAKRFLLFKADLDSGAVTRLATLPPRASVATINADETLGAGTCSETDAGSAQEYGRQARMPIGPDGRPTQPGGLVQPQNKGEMMEGRLAARIPTVVFTVDLRTGETYDLFHTTDWIGHMLFSPTEPTLLMYCHEGPWQKVDRIWSIRTDGTQNTLMHKRTMLMEIAGHEFWGWNGDTIWYDWQTPKGEDFWLAGYDLKTRERVAFHMKRDEWSIHFNVTPDAQLFTGDGGDPEQVAHATNGEWIYLFHPEMCKNNGGIDSPDLIKPGVFHAERLVNMSHHNYHLEPNVRFSPDKKLVFFTSNMFGPSYVFAVEVNKASAGATDIESTPELGRRFSPDPKPTH